MKFRQPTVEYFTQGECYALALALHDLTGWPIVGVSGSQDEYDDITGGWSHVLVRTPDHKYLDITGIHTSAILSKGWSRVNANDFASVIIPTKQEQAIKELREVWYCAQYPKVISAKAKRYAPKLLALWQEDPTPRHFVPPSWWASEELCV